MTKSLDKAGMEFSGAAIPKRLAMSLPGGLTRAASPGVGKIRVPGVQKGKILKEAPNLVGSSSGRKKDRRDRM